MTNPKTPLDLSVPSAVHIIGIGGAGMSGIAQVLSAMGHRVSGSDLRDSEVLARLRSQGIDAKVGHMASNLGDARIVTHSPAVGPSNIELKAALENGRHVAQRAEILAAISRTKRTIGVAGTHGKTTTSSMLALILREAGMEPSFLIGADVHTFRTNAIWSKGDWLVLEADESYGTFRSLEPALVVVTNIEADHLDHYETFEELKAAFSSLMEAGKNGVIVCADDPVAKELGLKVGAISVGTDVDASYRISDVEQARSSVSYSLSLGDKALGKIDLPIPGLHNARNSAVASVAALQAGVSFEVVSSALNRFTGVPRRFEWRGVRHGVTFIDDYAHLPTEVKVTLATARQGGWDRVIAVFQPHRYSRTKALFQTFGNAFGDADEILVTDIYSAGESPIPGINGQLVASAIARTLPTRSVSYYGTRKSLRKDLAKFLRSGDVCVTLGAGDLTTLPDEIYDHDPNEKGTIV